MRTHWLRPWVAVCVLAAGVGSAQAQNQPLPTREDICDTLAAYRARWTTFDAEYTAYSPALEQWHTDILAYDAGRIYIERSSTNASGKGLPEGHSFMCFDGENSYAVTPREGKASLALVLPGFDRQTVDLVPQRCLLGAWLYEFPEPLDRVLRDASWETVKLVAGERVGEHPTILLELTRQENVRMVMRYWLASEMDYLPVRRQLLLGDGSGEKLLNEYRVNRFEWFTGGYFPVDIEWRTGDTLPTTLKVSRLEVRPGVFDKLFAAMLTPPANVTDIAHDRLYRLVADTEGDAAQLEGDRQAEEQLGNLLAGVDPAIADRVRQQSSEILRARAASNYATIAGDVPSARSGRSWPLVVGGLLGLLGLASGWWWVRHRSH